MHTDLEGLTEIHHSTGGCRLGGTTLARDILVLIMSKSTENGMVKPTQPQRNRVGDWTYTQIRDAILHGEIAPGTRLSVPDLARQLNVSRSPARESVLRLLAEGLAVETPHRGASVANITTSDLQDLYSVRSVLEGLAARLTVLSRFPSRDDLGRAVLKQRRAVEINDFRAIAEADMFFHTTLYSLSGNRRLEDSLLRMQNLVRLGMRTTMRIPGASERALEEHQQIWEAIQSGDAELAESCARSHIDRLVAALPEPLPMPPRTS